ncbi:hypothetical protein ACFQL7_26430 [Halocatena marina]|uniref:Fumarylacetoacetase-like C-terminal domain-containing protein n=1 Tax=Halocatena marina TaxID=2934937 RepID=A0ABD5YZS9_9EURY
MRIGRFEKIGSTRIGVFEDGVVRDVTAEFDDFRDAVSRPADATDVDGESYSTEEITHLPPTTDNNTVFCAALNYEAHAEESDIEVPEWPLVFLKLPGRSWGKVNRSRITHALPKRLTTKRNSRL